MKCKYLLLFVLMFCFIFTSCNETEECEHEYGEYHEGIAATCTTSGYKGYYYCSKCGRHFDKDHNQIDYFEIEPLEHDYIEYEEVPATCTTSGYKAYHVCSRCGETTYEEIPATGHVYDQMVVSEEYLATSATCTTKATYYYSCKCGEKGTETFEAGELLNHDFVHYRALEPTCTESGYEEYDVCTICGYSTYKELPALDHDIIHHDGCDATCTEDGYVAYDTCSRCNYTTYEVIKSNGHNYVDSVCTKCGDTQVFFKLSSDEQYYIVKSFENDTATTLSIPSTYKGLPVKEIASGAFDDATSLKELTIPSSIILIEEDVFKNCKKLYDLNYKGTIEDWCNINFKNIYSNPSSVCTNINFYDETLQQFNNLYDIEIPASITKINKYQFYNFKQLSVIRINNSLTEVDTKAFEKCANLDKIYYTGTLADWCSISFTDSYSNPMKTGAAFYLNNEKITELRFDSTVTRIGDYQFDGLKQITNIYIPKEVTYIGTFAFRFCNGTIYFEASSLPQTGNLWNYSELEKVFNYSM